MGYSDLDRAMIDIGLDVNDADDAEKIARLAQLDDEISRTLDLKLGRTFGGSSAGTEARAVPGPLATGELVLSLPEPIRSVTSVVITGSPSETLDSDDYVLWHQTRRGDAHALRRVDGRSWPLRDGESVITVTGQWSDLSPGGAVPDEIVAAATFLVVEEWRLRQSSPAGEIGPDGMTVRPRNPWGFEIVKTAIAHYSAAKTVVSF